MIFFDKSSYEIITFCWVCTILMSMTTFKSYSGSASVSLSKREDTWSVKLEVSRQYHTLLLLELLAFVILL